MKKNQKLCVALDFPNKKLATEFCSKIQGADVVLKVGLELFIAEGPSMIEDLKNKGFSVFLDLKLYDIPNTVSSAVKSACELSVDYLTLHLSGGKEMFQKSFVVLEKVQSPPKVLGVSILTSFDDKAWNEIHQDSLSSSMDHILQCAKDWKVPGLVCSPHELEKVKKIYPEVFSVTPGIRMEKSSNDDQKRVMTPKQAFDLGADMIVVGRPITQANDPMSVIHEVHKK